MSRHAAAALLTTLRLVPPPDTDALAAWWRRVDPRATAALVRWEGAERWLLRRLGETGLAQHAPLQLREGLRRLDRNQQARCMLIDADTEELLRHLHARRVPSVLIKGTARRAAAPMYPYADARATMDVDVLLPEASAQDVWRDLRTQGWPLAFDPAATPERHYHPAPLRGPNGSSVELHWSTGYAITAREAWKRATEGASELDWHGLRVLVPRATELLWHGLAHALVAGPMGFRLRYFLDGAAILASKATVDWERIADRLAAGREADPGLARAWLRSAADLAGYELPAAVRDGGVQFDLVRAVAWRLAVPSFAGEGRLAMRLLDEGTRADLGLRVAPVIGGTGPFKQARRRVVGRLARAVYGAWRVLARVAMAPATRRAAAPHPATKRYSGPKERREVRPTK